MYGAAYLQFSRGANRTQHDDASAHSCCRQHMRCTAKLHGARPTREVQQLEEQQMQRSIAVLIRGFGFVRGAQQIRQVTQGAVTKRER
jgi:hypothetical protein